MAIAPLASLAPSPPAPALQRIAASIAVLGEGMTIRRVLPTRLRRMVGPWCFLDHFGPVDVSAGPGLRVGPHPHIGLQTVTWLYEGEILHRDSLGSLQLIRPGQVNLMTSGEGISHSEESPTPRSPGMHGLQFWIALPDEARHVPAAFSHHPLLPQVELEGLRATLIVGEGLGLRSPAQLHSPAVGLDLQIPAGGQASLPLDPVFEHALLVSVGSAQVEGQTMVPGELLYLGGQRSALSLSGGADGARAMLIGGQAFAEPITIWWNFVARSKSELGRAVREWNAGAPRFGTVQGYDGAPLLAPLPPWSESGPAPTT